MKYRIYIDEVGNADLNSSDNENHRFLSLTGVIVELGHIKNAVWPQLEELKVKYFSSHPDDPVILHRKDIINSKYPFRALRDPQLRHAFDKELLQLLSSWQYNVITVCIDKKEHKEKYTVWQYDPYHYCLTVMLERYVSFLEMCSSSGDALSESRGTKEDRRLKNAFSHFWGVGTDYIASSRVKNVLTSKELKVRQKKENISGLQLADLLAHPSRNEILREQNLLIRSFPPFAEEIVCILQLKYLRKSGRIQGWGKKFL